MKLRFKCTQNLKYAHFKASLETFLLITLIAFEIIKILKRDSFMTDKEQENLNHFIITLISLYLNNYIFRSNERKPDERNCFVRQFFKSVSVPMLSKYDGEERCSAMVLENKTKIKSVQHMLVMSVFHKKIIL